MHNYDFLVVMHLPYRYLRLKKKKREKRIIWNCSEDILI